MHSKLTDSVLQEANKYTLSTMFVEKFLKSKILKLFISTIILTSWYHSITV